MCWGQIAPFTAVKIANKREREREREGTLAKTIVTSNSGSTYPVPISPLI